MNIITKCFKHFIVITKHKYEVMKACFKAGLYWQGITHDLSKYSISEFVTSAKYFQGKSSPIDAEKIEKVYSHAWLHHRGRNPHHWEYWMDNFSKGGEPMKIPYKYCMEMICDWIGAGKVYGKDKWTTKEPEQFFNSKLSSGQIILHPHTEYFLSAILERFSVSGYYILDEKLSKDIYKYLDKTSITNKCLDCGRGIDLEDIHYCIHCNAPVCTDCNDRKETICLNCLVDGMEF